MKDSNFVADGYERARTASEVKVRAEVEAKYASQMVKAEDDERARVRADMEREIERRIQALAPPDALY